MKLVKFSKLKTWSPKGGTENLECYTLSLKKILSLSKDKPSIARVLVIESSWK